MFYHKKYGPTCFEEILHNSSAKKILINIAKEKSSIPNIICGGCSGSGKTVLIRAFLYSLYGEAIYNLRQSYYSLPSGKLYIESSIYHFELDVKYVLYMKRDIIIQFIKEISCYKHITDNSFQIVVLKNAHLLLPIIQSALRRIMEINFETIRFIYESTFMDKMNEAIRSRCLHIRIRTPTHKEMENIIKIIISKEKLKLKKSIVKGAINLGNRNIEKTINLIQLYGLNTSLYKEHVKKCPYKKIFMLIKKGNMSYIEKIMDIAYELYIIDVHCLDIVKAVLSRIIKCKKISFDIKSKAIRISAQFDCNNIQANKEMIHMHLYLCEMIGLFM